MLQSASQASHSGALPPTADACLSDEEVRKLEQEVAARCPSEACCDVVLESVQSSGRVSEEDVVPCLLHLGANASLAVSIGALAAVLRIGQIQWHSINLKSSTVGPLLVKHAALLGSALRRPDLFAALDVDASPDVAVALVMTVLLFGFRYERRTMDAVLAEVSVAADYCLRFAAAKLAAPDWAKDPHLSMYPAMLHAALLLADHAPAALGDGSDVRLMRIMVFALHMTTAKVPPSALDITLGSDVKRRLMEDALLLKSAVKALASLGKVQPLTEKVAGTMLLAFPGLMCTYMAMADLAYEHALEPQLPAMVMALRALSPELVTICAVQVCAALHNAALPPPPPNPKQHVLTSQHATCLLACRFASDFHDAVVGACECRDCGAGTKRAAAGAGSADGKTCLIQEPQQSNAWIAALAGVLASLQPWQRALPAAGAITHRLLRASMRLASLAATQLKPIACDSAPFAARLAALEQPAALELIDALVQHMALPLLLFRAAFQQDYNSPHGMGLEAFMLAFERPADLLIMLARLVATAAQLQRLEHLQQRLDQQRLDHWQVIQRLDLETERRRRQQQQLQQQVQQLQQLVEQQQQQQQRLSIQQQQQQLLDQQQQQRQQLDQETEQLLEQQRQQQPPVPEPPPAVPGVLLARACAAAVAAMRLRELEAAVMVVLGDAGPDVSVIDCRRRDVEATTQALEAVKALHDDGGGAAKQEFARQLTPALLVATLAELADNGQTLTSGFDAGAVPAMQAICGMLADMAKHGGDARKQIAGGESGTAADWKTVAAAIRQVVRGQPARLRIMVDRALQQVDTALQGGPRKAPSGTAAAAAPKSQSDADAAMQALLVCELLVMSHSCFGNVHICMCVVYMTACRPGYWLPALRCVETNNHRQSQVCFHPWRSGEQQEEGHAGQGAQQPSKAALKRARKKAAQKAAGGGSAESATDAASASAPASQPGERLPCSGSGGISSGSNARLDAAPDAHGAAAGIEGVSLEPAAGAPAAASALSTAVEGSTPARWMLCPISKVVMTDPVLCCDGHSYQRIAIAEWFAAGNKCSPVTGLPLENQDVIHNFTLRSSILAALQRL